MLPKFIFEVRENNIRKRRVTINAKDKINAFKKIESMICRPQEDYILLSEWDILLENLVNDDTIWLTIGSLISSTNEKESIDDRIYYLKCLFGTNKEILDIEDTVKQKVFDCIEDSIRLLEQEKDEKNS